MLQHVYEAASRASRLSAVWVATDDRRIFDAVVRFGGRALMTRADHATGSDRVAEVAGRPEAEGIDIIVNIQGDQPMIGHDALDRLVAAFDDDPDLRMATLFEPLSSDKDLRNPNVAKVVADRRDRALYFSRSPIPYAGNLSPRGGREGLPAGFCKHVGVYAFRKDFLFEFRRLERGPLEALEGLEQLRALEAGHSIRLVRSAGMSVSVETPEDLERVQAMMNS